MVMVGSVSLAALAVIAALVAIVFWLAKWARGAEAVARDEAVVSEQLKDRIDELARSVEDRDRALAAKESEVVRLAAALTTTEAQRDDAINLTQDFAAANPAAAAVAMRAQLERLRALSAKVPDVPAVPSTEDR